MIDVHPVSENDKSIWDDYIMSSGNSGPYLMYSWGKAINKAYGHKTYFIMAFGNDGKPVGALPLVLIKPPLLKGTLVSLPFCDYGGAIFSDRHSLTALIDYSLKLVSTLNANLEIRSSYELPGLRETYRMGTISQKVRMILELPGDSKTLQDSFKSKLRSQIKKPEKEGLAFRLGSIDLLDDFYDIFRVNMRALGSPVHSRKWITSVLECFSEKALVGIVYKGTKPAGGGIILLSGETVTIPWASTLAEYNRLSPNMLLYWGFLKYASDNGFKYFDFGRSTPGEGTYRFKEQWGAVPCPLFWYGDRFREDPEPEALKPGIREKIARIWSMMPQQMTDIIGPVLRRYISL